jgi:single-stranded DNA-binding protein
MNTVTLVGHVLEAPKLRQHLNRTAVTFPLATPREVTDDTDPRAPRFDLHCVKAVGEVASTLPPLERGDVVLIRGTLRSEMTRGNGQLIHRSVVRASEVELNPPGSPPPLGTYVPTFQVVVYELIPSSD